jgi:hypothetical protein
MSDMGERMSSDFREVLADVVDGQGWVRYAGPGAGVRKRGARRRRRVAMASATGVTAVVVVAVAAGAGLVAGGSDGSQGWALRPGDGKPSTTASGNQAIGGRYADLTKALLHADDPGPGFRTSGPVGIPEPAFNAGPCAKTEMVAVVGSPVEQEFDGVPPGGVQISSGEILYQFADGGSARRAFETAEAAAQHACSASNLSVTVSQDFSGVGDGMFVVQQSLSSSRDQWVAYALDGGVIITYQVRSGTDQELKKLPDGWLAAVMQKAVSRLRSAPRSDTPLVPTPPIRLLTPTVHIPQPVVATEPVDGFLFAPSDLGAGFTADKGEESHDNKEIPASTSATGVMYRATITGGDGEFLVNEAVYRFTDAAAAQAGLTAYDKSQPPADGGSQPLSGFGDRAWIKHWKDQQGGLTVAIQTGDKVLTFDVLAGGASADQPIPGGDAWVRQIAHVALQRLAAARN